MVECTSLENWRTARYRGFESHPLRHLPVTNRAVAGLNLKAHHPPLIATMEVVVQDGEPQVIEYNCRLGDPETESVMPRIKSDFLNVLWNCGKGEIAGSELLIDDRTANGAAQFTGEHIHFGSEKFPNWKMKCWGNLKWILVKFGGVGGDV